MTPAPEPTVLVCAGHDPTGGAGVDADAEAVAAAGGRALTVVTTETDQDGTRVRGFRARPAEAWEREARGLLEEHRPGALKFGLLTDAPAVRAAARLAREAEGLGLACVVDPVLAASGGERFLAPDAVEPLRARLVAAGAVVTPNLIELAELAEAELGELRRDADARLEAAERLLARGARGVVVKDGHGAGDAVRDLVVERGAAPRWVELPRVPGGGIHGSGCRHASTLAAHLAAGLGLAEAAERATRYLARRIEAAARDAR